MSNKTSMKSSNPERLYWMYLKSLFLNPSLENCKIYFTLLNVSKILKKFSSSSKIETKKISRSCLKNTSTFLIPWRDSWRYHSINLISLHFNWVPEWTLVNDCSHDDFNKTGCKGQMGHNFDNPSSVWRVLNAEL